MPAPAGIPAFGDSFRASSYCLAAAFDCCLWLYHTCFSRAIEILRLLTLGTLLSRHGTTGVSSGFGQRDPSTIDFLIKLWDQVSPGVHSFPLTWGHLLKILQSFILMQTDTRMERRCIYYPHLSATNPAQFHAFRTNSRQRATGRGSISQYLMPNSVS